MEHYDAIFHALDRLGLEYEVIDCLPFTDKLEFKTDRKDVFCFGTVKMANLATKEGFNPGSFYGGDHDFLIYKSYYKDNLLNFGSMIQPLSAPINFHYTAHGSPYQEKALFIRPTVDSKIFNGGVYTKCKWEDIVERLNGKYDEHIIQVSLPRRIYKEARVWIVDGKVVTSSYYKFHTYDAHFETEVSPEGLEFAQEMANIWQPAPAFVMDICLTLQGWKIVELNCINCSGFYKGDMQKVLIALEDLYE